MHPSILSLRVTSPVDGWAYPNNLLPKTWGFRTGKLATIQMPFIVVLAMKNNVVTCESTMSFLYTCF